MSTDLQANDGWKSSDFPEVVCASCIGCCSYFNMARLHDRTECKICKRLFTGFIWRPRRRIPLPKTTEICQSCCELKNICQLCLLPVVRVQDSHHQQQQLQQQNHSHLPTPFLPQRDLSAGIESIIQRIGVQDSLQQNHSHPPTLAQPQQDLSRVESITRRIGALKRPSPSNQGRDLGSEF